MIDSYADLLSTFEQKLQVIRDRVRSVAERYQTAAYLTGRPGTSKTFTVKEELERLGVPHVIRNARMTPMGLFDLLHDHPDHVVVIDDIASLFKEKQALQILMAALDGDPAKPRKVTYKSKDKDLEFEFSGGIIAISNISLASDPLANAVSSRVVLLEHDPSDEELAAFARKLAANGDDELTVEQCQEVVQFVVEESRNCSRRFDLRHVTKAYCDRKQWEDGQAVTPWRELVRTSMKKLLNHEVATKTEEIEDQRKRVAKAIADHPNDLRAQLLAACMKRSTFYKRRKELGLHVS